ncbi:hypothetical protein [Bacillus sp. BPN334]|nr:hypothetical protein [Bacillus sp. BPN334]
MIIFSGGTMESFCEDGEHYAVHKWGNECGHIAKYMDSKKVNCIWYFL